MNLQVTRLVQFAPVRLRGNSAVQDSKSVKPRKFCSKREIVFYLYHKQYGDLTTVFDIYKQPESL